MRESNSTERSTAENVVEQREALTSYRRDATQHDIDVSSSHFETPTNIKRRKLSGLV